MYIEYNDQFQVVGMSSNKPTGKYIVISEEEYSNIPLQYLYNYDCLRVSIKSKTVILDKELEEEKRKKQRQEALEQNKKDVEITELMLQIEQMKRIMDLPTTFNLTWDWNDRIENNFATDEQIRVIRELNLV